MVDFAGRLRTLRQSKGISQKHLADALKITKSMVSAYENQIRMPSYDVLINISRFFHVTVDYLLGFDARKLLDVSGLDKKQIEILNDLIDQLRK